MNKTYKEDEIEIIGLSTSLPQPGAIQKSEPPRPPKSRWRLVALLAAAGVLIVVLVALLFQPKETEPPVVAEQQPASEAPHMTVVPEEPEGIYESESITQASAVVAQEATDVIGCVVSEVNSRGYDFKQLTPCGATPSLHVGPLDFKDTSIILALQAADIRKDNKQVVGACVHDGQLISRGMSKQGFCAIIHGVPTVGVSAESPLLESAIETNGDFFRQYPLVDNGRPCESNLEAATIRRALCQQANKTFVVESLTPITMKDFSLALADLGIDNAIYLVGSAYACGSLKTPEGDILKWGHNEYARAKNVTYLVWR